VQTGDVIRIQSFKERKPIYAVRFNAPAKLKVLEDAFESSSENILLKSTKVKTLEIVDYDEETSAKIVATAKKLKGIPYRSGGSTPKGFDCSGYTSYVYKKAGISIPRTAREQSGKGTYIPISKVKPGDIVCWDKPGTSHHVGIYIGGKKFIHSVQSGDVIRIQTFAQRKPVFAVRY
jgi:cell wall-associated NlpC family hydrolase